MCHAKNIQTRLSTESELLYQSTQISKNSSTDNKSTSFLDPENTPLHNSLLKQSLNLNCSKIIRLLNLHPEHASTGELPLHCACFTNSSIEVIKLLIELHPDGAKQCDSERMLPLHFACLVGATMNSQLGTSAGCCMLENFFSLINCNKSEEVGSKS